MVKKEGLFNNFDIMEIVVDFLNDELEDEDKADEEMLAFSFSFKDRNFVLTDNVDEVENGVKIVKTIQHNNRNLLILEV